jgi:hypothetical protein
MYMYVSPYMYTYMHVIMYTIMYMRVYAVHGSPYLENPPANPKCGLVTRVQMGTFDCWPTIISHFHSVLPSWKELPQGLHDW